MEQKPVALPIGIVAKERAQACKKRIRRLPHR